MAERRDSRGLLDPHELAEAGPPEAIRLPVELIDPNPRNPRGHLVELEALAENIERFGLLQPITVRRQGERYELLGGHRRLAAFAVLRDREPLEPQWRTIPAVVRAFDDDDSYLALISSQVHSKGWRPREEAAALERLVVAGRNLKQIGAALNHSEAWASKRLRVYSDIAVSALVQTGRLATAVAEELLAVRDFDARRDLAQQAADEQWSKEQARGAVRSLRLSSQLANLDRKVLELVELLSDLNGRRITIATFRNLHVLRGRIDVLSAEARGETPKLPTIEQAEAVAGITPRAKARADAQRRKAGRRSLPPPR